MDIPLKVLEQGLFCTAGEFFIDAWKPVPVCIVTHAHGDHAYQGHGLYIATKETLLIIHKRFGYEVPSKSVEYGEKFKMGKAWVSLHPAGHILGSSQIRIETANELTVVSGDYKRSFDATCQPFEVIKCDIFVTESTFALPIYQWPTEETILQQINEWWEENAANDHPSVLFCYSLGKAQRIMSLLANQKDKTIYLHGAVLSCSELYQQLGIEMVSFKPVSENAKGSTFSKDLILAPPSAIGTPWLKRFPSCRLAFASGWMEVRGVRRRKALDRGFILSDHADWNALIQTIEETEAKIILTTHGNAALLAQFLRETKNLDARELIGLSGAMEEEQD